MDFWTFVVALYVISTIFAITMTYREQKRRGHRTPVFAIIGYILCTVWPLVVAVLVIFFRPSTEPGERPSECS